MPMTLYQAFVELDAARFRAVLYRTWATTLATGLGHSQSLSSLGRIGNRVVENQRQTLLTGFSTGASIREIMQSDPPGFAPFERALLEQGEHTGALEQLLIQLSEYYTEEARHFNAIRQRLTYPVLVALVGSFCLPVPFFLMSNPTLYVVTTVGSIVLVLFFSGGLMLAAARWFGQRSHRVLARFARAMATALHAGLDLQSSLDHAIAAADHPPSSTWWAQVRDNGPYGRLSDLLATAPLHSPALLQVVRNAEQTGHLPQALERFAQGTRD